MGWTSVSDRSTGDTITSAIWNENLGASGNSKALRDGGIATSGQAANDIVIASSATQLDTVAAGTAGQFLKTNGTGSAPSWATVSSPLGVAEGRLTATSGTPVTVADVSGATSIYYTPYTGNKIALYDGSAWDLFTFTEITISLSGFTAIKAYDVFAYNNSGTVTIETVIWTNNTTRATGLVYQDGVLVKSGATTRRYLGTVYINAAGGQTEDTMVKRYLWNYYNRVSRPLQKLETTDSWTYTTATSTSERVNGEPGRHLRWVARGIDRSERDRPRSQHHRRQQLHGASGHRRRRDQCERLDRVRCAGDCHLQRESGPRKPHKVSSRRFPVVGLGGEIYRDWNYHMVWRRGWYYTERHLREH